jgi:hypothetical protein
MYKQVNGEKIECTLEEEMEIKKEREENANKIKEKKDAIKFREQKIASSRIILSSRSGQVTREQFNALLDILDL